MRISGWSSDVCSSDLVTGAAACGEEEGAAADDEGLPRLARRAALLCEPGLELRRLVRDHPERHLSVLQPAELRALAAEAPRHARLDAPPIHVAGDQTGRTTCRERVGQKG